MPTLIGLTLIIIAFLFFSKSRGSNNTKKTQDFWKKERDSRFVPKKDISTLDYIVIPLESLPFTDASGSVSAPSDTDVPTDGSYIREPEYTAPYQEELASVEQEIRTLAEGRILNLIGISNTELRLTYGTANLDPLTSYDQNFTTLIRALQKWGTLLASAGRQADAVTVLAYAVNIGSDIAATYALLARLYKEQGDLQKIEELKDMAKQLTTLMKPSILRDLEQVGSLE